MPIRRIPPSTDTDTGKPAELNPPCGGSWARDADGGLTPADEATARAAGLWDDLEPATQAPAPAPAKKTATATAAATTKE